MKQISIYRLVHKCFGMVSIHMLIIHTPLHDTLHILVYDNSSKSLRLMTHTARIRGVFDVANSPRYRVGIAPMLFQWSHSHIARFSSRIRRDFFPARFFCPRPLFIVRFFVCRANFPVQNWLHCCLFSIDNGPIIIR